MSKIPALRRSAKLLRIWGALMPFVGIMGGVLLGVGTGVSMASITPGIERNLPEIFQRSRELALAAGTLGGAVGLLCGAAARAAMRGIAVGLLALAEQAVPSQPRV